MSLARQESIMSTEAYVHPRFFSLKDQNITEPEQRSQEWFERRRNKLSGSKLSRFLFIRTQDERIQFAEEVFEGRKREEFTEEQKGYVKWGQDHEDIALDVLLNNIPNLIAMEAPMVQHSSTSWLASSPDGFYHLVDDTGTSYETGCIEIKCPAKKKVCNDKVTYYYVLQMHLEMACSGYRKAIFCSWGPKLCRAWKIEFNDDLWEMLCKLMTDLKDTKTDKAMPFKDWSLTQYRLKSLCYDVVDRAVSLYDNDGWCCE